MFYCIGLKDLGGLGFVYCVSREVSLDILLHSTVITRERVVIANFVCVSVISFFSLWTRLLMQIGKVSSHVSICWPQVQSKNNCWFCKHYFDSFRLFDIVAMVTCFFSFHKKIGKGFSLTQAYVLCGCPNYHG